MLAKEKPETFIEKCLRDVSCISKIDEYIDAFHEGGFTGEIHEFLGMTPKEYEMFLHSESALLLIVYNRKKKPDVIRGRGTLSTTIIKGSGSESSRSRSKSSAKKISR